MLAITGSFPDQIVEPEPEIEKREKRNKHDRLTIIDLSEITRRTSRRPARVALPGEGRAGYKQPGRLPSSSSNSPRTDHHRRGQLPVFEQDAANCSSELVSSRYEQLP
jgi:hypothetical protein